MPKISSLNSQKNPFFLKMISRMLKATNFLFFFLTISSCSKNEIAPVSTPSNTNQSAVKFILKVEAGTGGKVDISEGTFDKGTEVVIRAIPNNYFNFSGWNNGKSEIHSGSNHSWFGTRQFNLAVVRAVGVKRSKKIFKSCF